MKLFKAGSHNYTACEQIIERDPEAIATWLNEQPATAVMQQMAIDTCYNIIATNHDKYARASTGSIAIDIRTQQRTKIERYGDKAFKLSEKQLGVIARDLAQLANDKAV